MLEMEAIGGNYLTYQEHLCIGSTLKEMSQLRRSAILAGKCKPIIFKNRWYIPQGLLFGEISYEETVEMRGRIGVFFASQAGALIEGCKGDLVISLADLDPRTYTTKYDPVVIGEKEHRTGNIFRTSDMLLTKSLYNLSARYGYDLHLRNLP